MYSFQNQEELEKFLRPALMVRKKKLESLGIHVSFHQIFLSFKQEKWQFQKNLHLCEVVDDLLNDEIQIKAGNHETV